MDKAAGYKILHENIEKDLYHPDYKHVVALAKKYKQLITGKDMGELLRRFSPRESEELFKQRENLTIAITPAICHSLMTPYYKVPRTTPLVAKFESKKDVQGADKVIQEMQTAFNEYYGSDTNVSGVDFFMQNRDVELTFLDPNAWIVTEFDAFDEKVEKAKPRPFEVSSAMAVNFEFKNNVCQWLRVRQKIRIQVDEDKWEDGVKETLYADDIAIVFEQTAKKEIELQLESDQQYIEINQKFYIVTYYQTNIEKVPAFRVGYNRDLETDGRTYVNPFHPAMCYLDKCIERVSEFDLTNRLHVFPQKIVRLVKTCPGVPNKPGGCNKGRLMDGSTCPTCKGTGKPIHTSSQDVVEIELPENIKDDGFIPLTELVQYVALPIELLRIQKEMVDDFTPKCHQAVFNSTVLVQKAGQPAETEKTATAVDNDMESVYDTLSGFADKYSALWMLIVEFIAIITDNKDKVVILHRFPTNFKLKTRQHLYNEYDAASKGNMPGFVIESITDELAEHVFMDDADNLLRYRIRKRFVPFRGKTKEEILFLLSSDDILKETKVLYNYFEDIFQEIEDDYRRKGKDFYLESVEIMKTVVEQKIQEFMDEVDGQQAKVVPFGTLTGTKAPKTNASSGDGFNSNDSGEGSNNSKSDSGKEDQKANPSDPDLGRLPLAIQQLSLAATRAEEAGNEKLKNLILSKVDDLVKSIVT